MLIDLKKNVETIRWSDEPGSKEYAIDFSDEGLGEMNESLKRLKETLSETDGDSAESAEAIRQFITVIVGEECYKDALEYVDAKGVGAEGCLSSMMPLAIALADIVANHLEAIKTSRVEHYMRLGSEEAAVV